MKTKAQMQGEPQIIAEYKTKVAIIAALLLVGETGDSAATMRLAVTRARTILDEVDAQVDQELQETPGKAGL